MSNTNVPKSVYDLVEIFINRTRCVLLKDSDIENARKRMEDAISEYEAIKKQKEDEESELSEMVNWFKSVKLTPVDHVQQTAS